MLRRLALSLAAGFVALIALGFLLVAAYLWLETRLCPAAAAAVEGGGLVLIAAPLLFAGIRRGRSESPAPGQAALVVLRLVARSIRAAPEKALIAGLIAGVVSEWLDTDRKRKK